MSSSSSSQWKVVRCLASVFGRVNTLDARHREGGGGRSGSNGVGADLRRLERGLSAMMKSAEGIDVGGDEVFAGEQCV